MDYNIKSAGVKCSVTGREFQPGEYYYSVLYREGEGFRRQEISESAWTGVPEGAYASWKCRIPPKPISDAEADRAMLIPTALSNDQLLEMFDRFRDRISELNPADPAYSESAEKLYLITLWLVRRRVFRDDKTIPLGPEDRPAGRLSVYHPARDEVYHIPIVPVNPDLDLGTLGFFPNPGGR